MQRTELFANINVFPIDDPEAEDTRTPDEIEKGVPRGEAKQLVFIEENGNQIIYKMSDELVRQIAASLKMSNKALHYKIVEAAERNRARAILGEAGNGAAMPGAENVVKDILKGDADLRRPKA